MGLISRVSSRTYRLNYEVNLSTIVKKLGTRKPNNYFQNIIIVLSSLFLLLFFWTLIVHFRQIQLLSKKRKNYSSQQINFSLLTTYTFSSQHKATTCIVLSSLTLQKVPLVF